VDHLENPQQEDVFNRQNARGSVFLEKDKEPEKEKEESFLSRCCACCSLNYYKDYFKVTNKDVYKRILCNLKFWGGGFFQPA
jgi:tRNA(His) 5'-end guanylyltransferase